MVRLVWRLLNAVEPHVERGAAAVFSSLVGAVALVTRRGRHRAWRGRKPPGAAR